MAGYENGFSNIFGKEIKTILIAIFVGAFISPIILSLPFVIDHVHDITVMIMELPGGRIWLLIPLIMAGLIMGLVTRKIAPEVEGPGLRVAAEAFHSTKTRLRKRSGPFKYIATVITLGAGATTGVVSPSALIGYSLGSSIAWRLGIDKERMKTISLCGMAAAISALLETPLGAAIFAIEIGYRNRILYKRFFHILTSSTTAFLVSKAIRPRKSLLDISGEVIDPNIPDVLTMIFIAIVVTLLCIAAIKTYQGFHDRFIRMDWKGFGWLKPAFGFFLAGLLIIAAFPVLSDLGYIGGFSGKLIELDDINVSRIVLAGLVVLITSIVITSSGNSGGLLMPIMAFGAIFGVSIASFFTATDPLVFAAVGMAAAIATALNVPLAAAVICMELFGLPVFLPSIIGSIAGYFIGRRYVIYHEIRWHPSREQ
jgi:CIC family chloride channel protein